MVERYQTQTGGAVASPHFYYGFGLFKLAMIIPQTYALGRDLAIKVLLESHKDKPDVVQRFVEEAQIGGQLQHPGIVPVYELGQFADERPYFSMKLVKGQTLAALLSERVAPTVDRTRFLGIYQQICQTLAYAHSRGVIHRDLKPANIMVGAFGEVQVMDWGLAKVLSVGGVADEKKAHQKQQDASVIRTVHKEGSDVCRPERRQVPDHARREITA